MGKRPDMPEQEKTPQSENPAPERERSPARSTPPRGNPERDQQSVEKGEDQLDKISGN
jgi:hypothetical protein